LGGWLSTPGEIQREIESIKQLSVVHSISVCIRHPDPLCIIVFIALIIPPYRIFSLYSIIINERVKRGKNEISSSAVPIPQPPTTVREDYCRGIPSSCRISVNT